MNINFVSSTLAYLTLAGDIFLAALLLLWLVSFALLPAKKAMNALVRFVHGKDRLFAFIVAAIAMSGSLFYSEVAKYTPCLMCWYQRIAIYPMVMLFGVDIFKKKAAVRDHALGLSVVGALLASYHYLLQLGIIEAESCALSGYSVSCAQKFTLNLGYITIPVMALTACLLIIAFMLLGKAADRMPSEEAG